MSSTFPPQPPHHPQPQAQKTSALAIVALISAFLCFPLGVVLGIVALVKISRDPALGGKWIAITAIILSCAFVLCLLPAIAIPNFIRFQARAKQSECKANLKVAYTAQRMLRLEQEGGYSESPDALSFRTESTSRYAYFMGSQAPVFEGEARNAVPPVRPGTDAELGWQKVQAAGIETGIQGECPDACEVTLACAGNLDRDETYDVWSISTADREIDGVPVPAGTVHNHVNDVTD